jgi:hypothetical protein
VSDKDTGRRWALSEEQALREKVRADRIGRARKLLEDDEQTITSVAARTHLPETVVRDLALAVRGHVKAKGPGCMTDNRRRQPAKRTQKARRRP